MTPAARLRHPADRRKRAGAPARGRRRRGQSRFQPRAAEGQADRGGEALRHPAVAAARHRGPRRAGRQSEAQGGVVDEHHAGPHRSCGGDRARHSGHQHPGDRHRRHRRHRLWPAARGRAQHRAGRQAVPRRHLSGLAVQPSGRRGGDRQDARPRRLRPHRPGDGAPRPRLRHDDHLRRSAPAAAGGGEEVRRRLSQLRRSAARGRFRLAASAALAGDAPPDERPRSSR